MTVPANIFRAYDIRGIADTELTAKNIERIGKAIGSLALESGQNTLLSGADGRLSSPSLSVALQKGILSTGCNLVHLGIIPTPLLYFATHETAFSSGIMLTASHNPAEYNGIKMVNRRTCLNPEQIQLLRQRIELGGFTTGKGALTSLDIKDAYIQRVTSDIELKRPLRLVVDCGNAVPCLIAPDLFEALGCHVTKLFCEVDGHFPNHHPDPTCAENLVELIASVRQEQADLGIAFDGDGDRVIMVTNSGTVIDTDRLLMLFIRAILPKYQNPGEEKPSVVFDVKCSNLLVPMIQALNGKPVINRSGHSFMKQTMLETGAVVGAEFSAHVFIKDRWYGFDDGMYVAARFLELLAAGSDDAETMLQSLPASIVTPELRIAVSDDRKFDLMERIARVAKFPNGTVNLLDGVRADFKDGWGLIRASNTTPALLLRFEANSEQSLHAIQQLFRELLRKVDNQLDIGF